MKRNSGKKQGSKSVGIRFLHDRYIGNDPERLASLEEERANFDVAQKIYNLRASAGLTQRKLAKLVGTTASVICQLEDSDYQGHSLSMLRRIAAALDKQVQIRFVAAKRKKGLTFS